MRPTKTLDNFDNSYLPLGLYFICEPSKDLMSEWIFGYECHIEFEAVVWGL